MQGFLVIEMVLMLMLVVKLDIRNIEQELGRRSIRCDDAD